MDEGEGGQVSEHVVLKIHKCGECPHRRSGPLYSLDGFDRGCDWICTKAQRAIVEFVERTSDEPKAIPAWCPLREQKASK